MNTRAHPHTHLVCKGIVESLDTVCVVHVSTEELALFYLTTHIHTRAHPHSHVHIHTHRVKGLNYAFANKVCVDVHVGYVDVHVGCGCARGSVDVHVCGCVW